MHASRSQREPRASPPSSVVSKTAEVPRWRAATCSDDRMAMSNRTKRKHLDKARGLVPQDGARALDYALGGAGSLPPSLLRWALAGGWVVHYSTAPVEVKKTGEVILLVDSITRPNGIAFFPDEKKVMVANSDPAKPYWYIYDVTENDSLINGKIFYDPYVAMGKDVKGLPDGFKIDKNGNVFATGPGGVWIFNKEGKLLGKLKLSESASNCALSSDEKKLYITNDMYVLRLKMRD